MAANLRSQKTTFCAASYGAATITALLLASSVSAAEPDVAKANDGERLLNLMFGEAACVHPTHLCLEAPSYTTSPDKLINKNAPAKDERGARVDRSLFPRRGDSRGPSERPETSFVATAQNLGVVEYIDRLGADLLPLAAEPAKVLRAGAYSPHWGVRATDWQHGLKEGEDQKIFALYIETGTSKDRPFGDKSLAHLLTTFTKGGQNIEYDALLPNYIAQIRKTMPPDAKEVTLKDGAVQFRLDTEHESAAVLVGLESQKYQDGSPVPGSTKLYILKSVFSWDALRRLRAEAARVESEGWLERRLNATGMPTKDELFEYELAAAKKLISIDPAKALSNLAPLAFFPQANTEAALAIKRDALKSLEAKQRAEKQEADRRAAAELAAKAKRDAAARKAQAEATAKSKALLAGVNQALTPEGALFDIDAAKGQVAIWQGSLVKKLFGTTYLAATGGMFWCLRIEGNGTGQPGYFVAKGTVTGGCKITDGIRDLNVPQLAGTFVDFP